ncbi:metallophosphoesterase family protein [Lentilactobacillus kosonis]|uniref:DNA repair exonuclease family protein YhaO n=1 Tax=Lentilactobacillus kosonis TaxID=2810561 RepID=A0A401FK89_9LACO|nr:DNA repair exonuclease [Lentilactobacillus kosonis]GAY72810.1 DNA repair exonuclease family protein YhaO [Lentilactobacillus kosonis]
MKFIHAADIHLDSPFSGLIQKNNLPADLESAITKSTFSSFEQIITDAISNSVDFVIIAGDLFDRNGRSIAADVFINDQFNLLAAHQIPVFLIFGNHDFFNFDNKSVSYPENVHVFNNDVSTTEITLDNGQTVALSGFSFKNQWIHESYADSFPVKGSSDWAIGIMHGSADSIDSPEANYAPFSVSQLEAKHYDYWALGHIHKRQSLNDAHTINYAGNSQGRSINEAGDKGYLMVSSEGNQLIPEFKKTDVIDWRLLVVDIDDLDINQIVTKTMAQLADLQLITTTLVRVVFKTEQPNTDISANINNGDLLAVIQSTNAKELATLNAFVVSLKYQVINSQIDTPLDQQFFDQAAIDVLNPQAIDEYQNLFSAYKFILDDLNDPESVDEIIQTSRQLISEKINYDQGDNDN